MDRAAIIGCGVCTGLGSVLKSAAVKPGSTVAVDIGGNKFDLFTEGENAWTGSSSEDAKLIAALRAGSSATLTAVSSRGTKTVDTFSLSGITAAQKVQSLITN